jgi:hypothetical protein
MKKIIFYFFLLLPHNLLAQTSGTDPNFRFENPIAVDSFPALIYSILDAVVKIGAVFIVLFIVYAGFLFVKAQGSSDKITQAKTVLFYTLIGAIILLGAEAIAEVVCHTAQGLGSDVSCIIDYTPRGRGSGVDTGFGSSTNPINSRYGGGDNDNPYSGTDSDSEAAALNSEVADKRDCISAFKELYNGNYETVANVVAVTNNDEGSVIDKHAFNLNNSPKGNTFDTYIPDKYYEIGVSGDTSNYFADESFDGIKNQVNNYDSVMVSVYSYESGNIEFLDLKSLVNDEEYANNPRPINANGYITGVSFTNDGVHGDFESSSEDSSGAFVRNGYETSSGKIPVTDEICCFDSPSEDGTIDLSKETGGRIDSNYLLKQQPLETVGTLEEEWAAFNSFMENGAGTETQSFSLFGGDESERSRLASESRKTGETIKDYKVKTNDIDAFNELVESQDSEKLTSFAGGAYHAECAFGVEGCGSIKNLNVVETEMYSNAGPAWSSMKNGDISVTMDELRNGTAEQLEVEGRHEAIHSIDSKYDISEEYAKRIIEKSKNGEDIDFTYTNFINESNAYKDTGTLGGHSRDSAQEELSSTVNALYSPDWEENVASKLSGSSRDSYQTSLEIWGETLKDKGFEGSDVVKKIDSAVEVLKEDSTKNQEVNTDD